VKNDGVRLGLEFSSAIHWLRPPDTLPTIQTRIPSVPATPLAQPRPQKKLDRLAVCRTFLNTLTIARQKLPEAIRTAIHRRPTVANAPATLLRCELCKCPLMAPAVIPQIALYIPLRMCVPCAEEAAPFAGGVALRPRPVRADS
jgi:hypothetical protein